MRSLSDVLSFEQLRALIPHMPPELVRLLLDMPPDVLDALGELLERVGTLDGTQLDALAIRIATVRSMRVQMTESSYREAILKAIAAKPH